MGGSGGFISARRNLSRPFGLSTVAGFVPRQRVGAVVYFHQPIDADVGVLLRRRQAGVSQELLNRAEVGAGVEQMRGAGVAHGVGMKIAAPCPKRSVTPDNVLHLPNAQSATAS